MDVFIPGPNQGNIFVTALIILGLVLVSSKAKMLDKLVSLLLFSA